MMIPTFDELLDRLWFYDCEVFAHDSLFVFIKYREPSNKYIFHNSLPSEFEKFFNKEKPILMGYNNKSYDQYILKCALAGYTPEEIKDVNDYIISGGNGWDINVVSHDIPTQWDLLPCIIPRKSLKELEGNLRMNITETTVPFDLPDKWNEEQYKEVLYYCTCDVEALFPIFAMLMNRYKSKYIIAKLGKIDPEYALSLTDANLTAVLLKAERKEHYDNFDYKYPSQVDKSKIPVEFLNYIDDLVEHNDLEYKPEAPTLDLKTIDFQVGIGGCHGFLKKGILEYDRGDKFECE